jgi:hypothetical protein
MRKTFVLFPTFIGFWMVACCAFGSAAPGIVKGSRQGICSASSLSRGTTLTVPADTQVSIELLSGIQSQVSHADDIVEARLLKPVSVDGHVVLPEGTLFTGRVLDVRQSGRLHRPAEIAFRFEQVALPDGQEKPIGAAIAGFEGTLRKEVGVDSEGDLMAKRAQPWKGLSLGIAGLGSSVALQAVAAGGSAIFPAFSAGSAGWLAYEVLWHRGNEVNVPPNTPCTIRLEYPVSVRIRD